MKKRMCTDKSNFLVRVDIFKVDIIFICNYNEKRTKKVLKESWGDKFSNLKKEDFKGWDIDTTLGLVMQFQGDFIVLLKGTGGGFKTFVSVMVHEITHVVQYLLRDRRIPLTEDTEEVHAYLTEYITREALLKLYY